MKRAKTLNPFLLLFTAIVVFSVCPRFCRAQNNSCETFGKCGPFGSCNSQESLICTCLRGFYPRNNQEWNSGNWSSGCLRRVPLSCEQGSNGTIDGFLKLQMMKISGYTSRWVGPQTQCEGRCLGNCSCLAYGYDPGIGCIFWDVALIDIQKFPGGSGSDLFVRISKSELDKKKSSNKKIIVVLVVVGLVILSICMFLSWKWIAKRRGRRIPFELGISEVPGSVQDALNQVNLEELPLFKFEVLATATDHFSEANKLGTGGFGPVYKGVLVNGREIAVK